MSRRPIILTRAGAPGEALALALAQAGEEVLWMPAFEFGPAPDEARVAALLAQLQDYDLAIFVSPASVEATARRLSRDWPASTAVGAVGDGTRRALLARIPSSAGARMYVPEAPDDATKGGGSELLWAALEPVLPALRRVLILRAEHGREWLSEQFAQAKIAVDTIAVYTRNVVQPGLEALATLHAWQAAGREAALVVASSEAVGVVVRQLETAAGAPWVHSAIALTTHERIAARLRAAGFARVVLTTLDVEAIGKAANAQ